MGQRVARCNVVQLEETYLANVNDPYEKIVREQIYLESSNAETIWGEATVKLNCAAAIAVFVTYATGVMADQVAHTIASTDLFDGEVDITVTGGTPKVAKVAVQTWGLDNRGGALHSLPIRGFYVAHLVSGAVSVINDGQQAKHLPGDYWTVKPGAAMQIKVLGDTAVVETTEISKQYE